jgi:hypothetical protein
LRQHCKATLEQLKDNNPKKQRARREQLLKKVGRYLTHKRSDKLPLLPWGLAVPAPAPAQDPAVSESSAEDDFVHVQMQDCPRPAKEAVDKAALTRRWLSGVWSKT